MCRRGHWRVMVDRAGERQQQQQDRQHNLSSTGGSSVIQATHFTYGIL